MAEKVILIADPGIDAAFATALALNDPEIELLALAASAGTVSAEQATRNAYIVIEQIDPARWPRIGTAPAVVYDRDQRDLHGPDGLGGQDFPCAPPHHTTPSDKLLIDTVRQNPGEVTVLLCGPATVLARALDRDPDIARMIPKLVVVGGSWHEPGDVSACAEFHFWCDPESARQVLRCGAPVTVIPLDASRRMIFSPNDIRHLGALETRTAAFLKRVVPMLLAPTAGLCGVEGVHVADALAVAFVSRPTAFTIKAAALEVETRGELTRGVTVVDNRWATASRPNVDLVTAIDVSALRHYFHEVLAAGSA